MDIDLDIEAGIRLALSLLVGAIIGFEREYHSKAAGLRTMIMTCLGSTIFTLISTNIGGDSPDRIASNVITGIGFLGAGVIFKDGLTISGITTATTIWICAALGMAIGNGNYFIAFTASILVILVLSGLSAVTSKIERYHQTRSYRIRHTNLNGFQDNFRKKVEDIGLSHSLRKELKDDDSIVLYYEITGSEQKLNELNVFLKNHENVIRYEY